MKNFDLSLGQWGPYNKNYSGSCHVADAENGIGFVFSLFPGFYRRNVMIPRTICDNGVKIMDASTDLSRYRYRYELMWKDVVYLDADYISNGNILDLSCKFVNHTDIAQTLVLNCCGYLQFPTLNGKENGREVCSDVQKTTKSAYKLCLRLENGPVYANGQDVAVVTCYCIDKDGLEVPNAVPTVEFHSNRLGEVIGTGSDISDHIPPSSTVRKMRAGRITVAVRTGNERGGLMLYAESDSLTGAALKIELK